MLVGVSVDWDAVGAIGEVLGSLAVVVTLVCLSVQIRQNTQSNRTAAIQTMAGQDSSWLSTVAAEPELASILSRGLADIGSLSGEEALRFSLVLAQMCRQYDSQLFLWRDGAIPPEPWDASLRTLESVMTQPGAGRWWSMAKERFSRDFQVLLDERLPRDSA